MDMDIHLDWKVSNKGYEIVEIDPDSVDWDSVNWNSEQGKPDPHVGTGLLPGAKAALDRWGDRLWPDEWDVIRLIEPIGSSTRPHHPLQQARYADTADTYVEFAHTDQSDESILSFTKQHGQIRLGGPLSVEGFIDAASCMRRVLEVMEKPNRRGPGKIIDMFNEMRPEPSLSVPLTSLEKNFDGKAVLVLRPDQLQTAMWLQLELAIVGLNQMRKCDGCSKFMAIAPGKGRADKKFCSDACRMRVYRANKRSATVLTRHRSHKPTTARSRGRSP